MKIHHTAGRNVPVRSTSLILAGIRADKYHHLTFPCFCKHSGIARWLENKLQAAIHSTCTPLRGQHTIA